MTKYFVLLLSLLAGCATKDLDQSNIRTIDSFGQVQSELAACNANTLITFDVDDTLITAYDALARTSEYPFMFKLRAIWRHPELLKADRFEWAASIMYEQAERYVFDSDVITVLERIKQNGCMAVALTSMESGSYGVISSMLEWRANMLKGFGIEFDAGFPDATFTNLPQYRGGYPVLHKSILCANQQNKAAVLGAFLDYAHLKPEKIISFDDDLVALEAIALECKKRGIDFEGFHYVGASKIVRNEWDTERALAQLDYLMEHGRWLGISHGE